MAAIAAAAGPAATDKVALAHARLLKAADLQFDFASAKPPPPVHTPGWAKSVGHFFEAVSPAMSWVFWGGLAIGAALILFFVGRELVYARWPKLQRKPKAQAAPEWRPTEAQARALLEDADRLASEGCYADAVRLLLFRSIEDIQGRRPHVVRPALTSRDIARHEGLPPDARTAFAGIAETVEHGFFGGREVDAERFAACRQAYEAFAFPAVWG